MECMNENIRNDAENSSTFPLITAGYADLLLG